LEITGIVADTVLGYVGDIVSSLAGIIMIGIGASVGLRIFSRVRK